jgi:hypothetical protein
MKKFTLSAVNTRISKAREQKALWSAYNARLDALKATLDAKVVEADAVALHQQMSARTDIQKAVRRVSDFEAARQQAISSLAGLPASSTFFIEGVTRRPLELDQGQAERLMAYGAARQEFCEQSDAAREELHKALAAL